MLLEDERIDPTVKRSVVLTRAVAQGREEVVKILLEDGRVNSNASEAVKMAKLMGRKDIVKMITEYSEKGKEKSVLSKLWNKLSR